MLFQTVGTPLSGSTLSVAVCTDSYLAPQAPAILLKSTYSSAHSQGELVEPSVHVTYADMTSRY